MPIDAPDSGDATPDREAARLCAEVRPRDWRNPDPPWRYDFLIIGAGPAGMTAARAANARGAKVALIERNRIGGNSLNVGCVPSKALLRTARLYAHMRKAQDLGAPAAIDVGVDMPSIMQRIHALQARLGRTIAARRLAQEGIDVYFGAARFCATDAVALDGKTLRFEKALIATGARPKTPSIAGLTAAGYRTNEDIFALQALPRRLLVIGGGPLGCELAQAFCRLGVHVIIVQNEPMFLPAEERDAAQLLSASLARDGLEIHLNTTVVAVRLAGAQKHVDLESEDTQVSVCVDQILTGIGRAPNVEDLALERAAVDFDALAGIRVNDLLRTSNPRIFAAGDVCLQYKFTNVAQASAHIAVENALRRRRQKMSALTVPWCTYTDPQIAHVGLYVREARERGIAVNTFTILMHDVDRAVIDGDDEGFHVRDGTDRILGATVVARQAGELISELCLAITAGIGLRQLARVIHAYPTEASAIKMAADAYETTRLRARRPSRSKVR